MTPRNRLLERLRRVRNIGAGRWIACCPAHEDRTPSLAIRELEGGRLLVRCFAGCETQDVIQAIGMEMADLFPDKPRANDRKAPRLPFEPEQVLRAVAHEIAVMTVMAEDLAAGRPVNSLRAALAATRLFRGLDALGERGAAEELRRIRQAEVVK